MSKAEDTPEKMEIGGGKKRVRQRKLNLYENIRKQMEFYFSTPNLQKDRFLKKLVLSDPEGLVDIATFLTFNKIKALTSDVTCIAKAIKESQMLKVDETGQRIGRKVKFEEPQDTDDRTVYAEFLPKDVTIDWLIRHFSRVGKVVHVSLPKYKSSGDVKGFAFVEFSDVKGAEKACELLNCPPEKLSDTQPGIFAKTFKTGKHMQKPMAQDDREPMEFADGTAKESEADASVEVENGKEAEEKKSREERSSRSDAEETAERKSKKKKRRRSESSEAAPAAKNGKPEVEMETELPSENMQDSAQRKKKKSKQVRPEDAVETEKKTDVDTESKTDVATESKTDVATESKTEVATETEPSGGCSEAEKSPTKKKSGRKNRPGGSIQLGEGLRVISKREWLDYRQDYYQRHKQSMTTLKTKIKEEVEKIKSKHQPKGRPLGEEKQPAEPLGEPDRQEEGLHFVPNVIIKVTLAEQVTKKFMKELMSESGEVVFLDMIEGDLTAHARCRDSDSASAILKTTSEEIRYQLLEGEEEKSYWEKVFSDREKRVNSKSKKKKVRGKDRVASRADRVLTSIREEEEKEGKKKKKKNMAIHVVFDD